MIEFEWIRVLLAFFVGYFLTISGSLSQIVTHNNLASPSTLGMDGLSVICIILGQITLGLLPIAFSLESFSFSIFLLFMIIIFFISKKVTANKSIFVQQNIQLLILIGLGFNLFVGAIFSVIQFLFMALNMEFPTGLWFGNFKYYSLSVLWVYLFIFVLLQYFLIRLAGKLRLMSIGQDFAYGLGIDIEEVRHRSLMISLFLTGLVISFFGVFSFLGLIFPHLLRLIPFFRKNMKNELLLGPILTGIVFMSFDVACYNLTIYATELPVGMVSSVFGSFALLILLMRKQLLKKFH